MATQTVEFRAAPGLTLTAKLFTAGSDTVVQTASAVTEATNRKGTYAATFTDPGAAEFELIAFSGTTPVCRWFCTLTLTTATFQAYEVRVASVVDKSGYSLTPTTGLGNQTANITGNLSGSVGSVTGAVGSVTGAVTVGTNNDKTGYSLTVSPPTAAQITTAIYAALPADHTVSGSYGVRLLLAHNSNRELQLTGSNHAAADVHEFQPDVITAAALATDAVQEIQSGLATLNNQTTILDRQGYALAVLAGTISDAQTAAETYQIVIGGSTYTVDFSGLDASGNRAGQTLTKT